MKSRKDEGDGNASPPKKTQRSKTIFLLPIEENDTTPKANSGETPQSTTALPPTSSPKISAAGNEESQQLDEADVFSPTTRKKYSPAELTAIAAEAAIEEKARYQRRQSVAVRRQTATDDRRRLVFRCNDFLRIGEATTAAQKRATQQQQVQTDGDEDDVAAILQRTPEDTVGGLRKSGAPVGGLQRTATAKDDPPLDIFLLSDDENQASSSPVRRGTQRGASLFAGAASGGSGGAVTGGTPQQRHQINKLLRLLKSCRMNNAQHRKMRLSATTFLQFFPRDSFVELGDLWGPKHTVHRVEDPSMLLLMPDSGSGGESGAKAAKAPEPVSFTKIEDETEIVQVEFVSVLKQKLGFGVDVRDFMAMSAGGGESITNEERLNSRRATKILSHLATASAEASRRNSLSAEHPKSLSRSVTPAQQHLGTATTTTPAPPLPSFHHHPDDADDAAAAMPLHISRRDMKYIDEYLMDVYQVINKDRTPAIFWSQIMGYLIDGITEATDTSSSGKGDEWQLEGGDGGEEGEEEDEDSGDGNAVVKGSSKRRNVADKDRSNKKKNKKKMKKNGAFDVAPEEKNSFQFAGEFPVFTPKVQLTTSHEWYSHLRYVKSLDRLLCVSRNKVAYALCRDEEEQKQQQRQQQQGQQQTSPSRAAGSPVNKKKARPKAAGYEVYVADRREHLAEYTIDVGTHISCAEYMPAFEATAVYTYNQRSPFQIWQHLLGQEAAAAAAVGNAQPRLAAHMSLGINTVTAMLFEDPRRVLWLGTRSGEIYNLKLTRRRKNLNDAFSSASASFSSSSNGWCDVSKDLQLVGRHGDCVTRIVLIQASQGPLVITASLDSTLKVFDMVGVRRKEHQQEQQQQSGVLLGSNSGAYTTSQQQQQHHSMTTTDLSFATLAAHEHGVLVAEFIPDFSVLVTAGYDEQMHVWGENLWHRPVFSLLDLSRPFTSAIVGVQFIDSTSHIAAVDSNGTMKLFCLAQHACLATVSLCDADNISEGLLRREHIRRQPAADDAALAGSDKPQQSPQQQHGAGNASGASTSGGAGAATFHLQPPLVTAFAYTGKDNRQLCLGGSRVYFYEQKASEKRQQDPLLCYGAAAATLLTCITPCSTQPPGVLRTGSSKGADGCCGDVDPAIGTKRFFISVSNRGMDEWSMRTGLPELAHHRNLTTSAGAISCVAHRDDVAMRAFLHSGSSAAASADRGTGRLPSFSFGRVESIDLGGDTLASPTSPTSPVSFSKKSTGVLNMLRAASFMTKKNSLIGDVLLVGHARGCITAHQLSTGQELQRYDCHGHRVSCIALHPLQPTMVSFAAQELRLVIWDDPQLLDPASRAIPQDAQQQRVVPLQVSTMPSEASSVCFEPTRGHLFLVCTQHSIIVFVKNLVYQRWVPVLRLRHGHEAELQGAAFAPTRCAFAAMSAVERPAATPTATSPTREKKKRKASDAEEAPPLVQSALILAIDNKGRYFLWRIDVNVTDAAALAYELLHCWGNVSSLDRKARVQGTFMKFSKRLAEMQLEEEEQDATTSQRQHTSKDQKAPAEKHQQTENLLDVTDQTIARLFPPSTAALAVLQAQQEKEKQQQRSSPQSPTTAAFSLGDGPQHEMDPQVARWMVHNNSASGATGASSGDMSLTAPPLRCFAFDVDECGALMFGGDDLGRVTVWLLPALGPDLVSDAFRSTVEAAWRTRQQRHEKLGLRNALAGDKGNTRSSTATSSSFAAFCDSFCSDGNADTSDARYAGYVGTTCDQPWQPAAAGANSSNLAPILLHAFFPHAQPIVAITSTTEHLLVSCASDNTCVVSFWDGALLGRLQQGPLVDRVWELPFRLLSEEGGLTRRVKAGVLWRKLRSAIVGTASDWAHLKRRLLLPDGEDAATDAAPQPVLLGITSPTIAPGGASSVSASATVAGRDSLFEIETSATEDGKASPRRRRVVVLPEIAQRQQQQQSSQLRSDTEHSLSISASAGGMSVSASTFGMSPKERRRLLLKQQREKGGGVLQPLHRIVMRQGRPVATTTTTTSQQQEQDTNERGQSPTSPLVGNARGVAADQPPKYRPSDPNEEIVREMKNPTRRYEAELERRRQRVVDERLDRLERTQRRRLQITERYRTALQELRSQQQHEEQQQHEQHQVPEAQRGAGFPGELEGARTAIVGAAGGSSVVSGRSGGSHTTARQPLRRRVSPARTPSPRHGGSCASLSPTATPEPHTRAASSFQIDRRSEAVNEEKEEEGYARYAVNWRPTDHDLLSFGRDEEAERGDHGASFDFFAPATSAPGALATGKDRHVYRVARRGEDKDGGNSASASEDQKQAHSKCQEGASSASATRHDHDALMIFQQLDHYKNRAQGQDSEKERAGSLEDGDGRMFFQVSSQQTGKLQRGNTRNKNVVSIKKRDNHTKK